jgi:hypothetical protein
VGCYGSTVVEVHNGRYGAGPLWYRVGQITGSDFGSVNEIACHLLIQSPFVCLASG